MTLVALLELTILFYVGKSPLLKEVNFTHFGRDASRNTRPLSKECFSHLHFFPKKKKKSLQAESFSFQFSLFLFLDIGWAWNLKSTLRNFSVLPFSIFRSGGQSLGKP